MYWSAWALSVGVCRNFVDASEAIRYDTCYAIDCTSCDRFVVFFCIHSWLDPVCFFFFLRIRRPPRSPLFPYTPLFRSRSSPPPERPTGPDRRNISIPPRVHVSHANLNAVPPVAPGARDIHSGSRRRLRHPRWLFPSVFSASCRRPFGVHGEIFPAFLRANVPLPSSSTAHQPFPPPRPAASEHAAQSARLLPPFRRASRPD